MLRPITGLFALSVLMACEAPFFGKCTCTLKACFEGVSVQLQNFPDTSARSGFAVRIAYADTIETPSLAWGSMRQDVFNFESQKLRSRKPGRIGVLIDYREGGERKSAALDSALRWTSSVCNACSGGSGCQDQMSHTAHLSIDLATALPD